MKLLRFCYLAVIVLFAVGCSTADNISPDKSIREFIFNLEDFEPDAATKTNTFISGSTVTSTWSEGDRIGVFPDMGGDQVSFTVTEGAGTGSCTFNGHGWALVSAAKYSAYYPFSKENYGDSDAYKNVAVSYEGQSQTSKGIFSVGDFDIMASTKAVPSFSGSNKIGGTCTFLFKHLGALLVIDVTFPKAATLSSLELVCSNDVFPEAGTVDLSQETAQITPDAWSNTLGLSLGGMSVAANETVRFFLMSAPADLASEKPSVKAVTTTGEVFIKSLPSFFNLMAGKAYSVSAVLESDPDDGLPATIHNGDRILVTNQTVEQFLTEVRYATKDYSSTSVLNYPVAPGESDIPPSFTIRWQQDASATALVATLWEDDWSREYPVSATAEPHVVISNLRPGASYHYRVQAASSDKVLTEGHFETYGHLHQVFFGSTVRNARDLGGWTTTDGRRVKFRKLYRGGKMSPKHLSSEGKADLLAEGIRAQLDLRGDDRISSCAFGSQYSFYAPYLTAGYLTMLGDGEKTKACFEFVVNCLRADKPVYFHCSAGRDRTGTMAMLLLGVLGVPEGDISQEYELSLFAPTGWSKTESETTVQTRLKSYKTTANYIWSLSNGNSFRQCVVTYLLSIGVSQTDIDDFCGIMLE
ncbi:MAG: tyrosine-protein phosphatase [Bacteroidales bacterium]|nr:tyrosine-protein phosphatase [Bacteroidales bacterium]